MRIREFKALVSTADGRISRNYDYRGILIPWPQKSQSGVFKRVWVEKDNRNESMTFDPVIFADYYDSAEAWEKHHPKL